MKINKTTSFITSRGFTLIELAIVLGVVVVLSAGVYRMMSNGSQLSKDQLAAQQAQSLINAATSYLSDTTPVTGGQAWLTSLNANAKANLVLPKTNDNLNDCLSAAAGRGYSADGGAGGYFATMCNYLPPGFTRNTTNPYGQTYAIQVLKDGNGPGTAPKTYSFMVNTTGGTAIPDTDGARISSLIGNSGGFVYSSPPCAVTAGKGACGNMNAWSIGDITTNYGFTSATAGTIAALSYAGPSQASLG